MLPHTIVMRARCAASIVAFAAVMAGASASGQSAARADSGRWELNATSVQLTPNASFQFQVGRGECCYVFRPAAVPATWSIEPARSASIDVRSGLVVVAKTAAPGSTFRVRARLAGGDTISAVVTVYTRETHPLVGSWSESAWRACTPRVTEVLPQPIRELVFRADGTFSATWTPFEVYKDYWGKYEYNLKTHVIDMRIEHGNFVPADFSGHGTAVVSGDTLTVEKVQLGSKPAGPSNVCGRSFVRTGA